MPFFALSLTVYRVGSGILFGLKMSAQVEISQGREFKKDRVESKTHWCRIDDSIL